MPGTIIVIKHMKRLSKKAKERYFQVGKDENLSFDVGTAYLNITGKGISKTYVVTK
jgi:hypothetical protein